MDKKKNNQIEYLVTCIGAFAEKYNLAIPQAYSYLKRFTGIDFLIECYDIEHTLSIENAVDDLKQLCRNNGGETPKGIKEYTPEFQFQVECVAKNLVTMLMDKYNLSMPEALNKLYTSETFDRLTDPECGLYYESPVYVFSFLQSEIETGKLA